MSHTQIRQSVWRLPLLIVWLVWAQPAAAQPGHVRQVSAVRFSFPDRSHQAVADRRPAVRMVSRAEQDSIQPALWQPIIGGVVGAPVGALTGGLFGGYLAAQEGADPWATVFAVVAGMALGEPWGVACGVHIANGRRGDAPAGIGAAIAVAVVGVIAAVAAGDGRVLLAVPVAQLAVVVPIERATASNQPRDWRLCRTPQ